MRKHTSRFLTVGVVAAVAASLLLLVACGSGPDPTPTSTPQPTATTAPPPTATSPAPEAAATDEPAATSTSAPQPSTATATDEPEATEPPPTEPAAVSRSTGDYEGYTFVVSEGSEATFTVEEQLASLSLPNDAVMRTTALTGEVHLDGRPSVVEIDLQQLSSDQSFRDRYVRNRMFGEYPVAIFTVEDIGGVPDGLAEGEEVATQVDGSLEVHGGVFPLEFEIQARRRRRQHFHTGANHVHVGPAGGAAAGGPLRGQHRGRCESGNSSGGRSAIAAGPDTKEVSQ